MLPLSSLESVQPPARPTVLCIDDGPLVLHFYRGFPEPRSCRVLTTTDGLRDIPIILLTALDNACVPGTGKKAGATRTLRKPADAGMLLTPIAQMIREWKGPPHGNAGPRWEHKELARTLKVTVKELAD